jgi:SAM-dependent methyltransferase
MATLYTTHADLYELAFSRDVSDEVAWLVERLGPECAPILEPACGAGRMLAALAARGIEAVGIDSSPSMIALARRRLERFTSLATVLEADMRTFELGERRFGGAFCPINTLAHLEDHEAVASHLRSMAAHLRPGSRYLVQLEMRDPSDPETGIRPSVWEAERADTRLRVTWSVVQVDLARGVELQRSRFEILAGPDRGRVVEEVHRVAAWTPERWAAAIRASPFTRVAVYDGDQPGRPRRPLEQAGGLLWHELVVG